jgi:N-acetylglucosaminyldiphosphoundecaprenol N-acetyl-beta-D-mannosaminyltransferase
VERDVTTIQIDTLAVDDVIFSEAVERLAKWARDGSGGYVTTPNVDHVVRAHTDEAFRRLTAAALMRVPDGMGIVYGSRLAGTPFRGSVTGRLLPAAVARATAKEPVAMALLGGRDDAAMQAGAALTRAGAKVVAAISPTMGFVIDGEEDVAAVEQLKAAAPGILFVGLGSPKQERWMAAHTAELPQTVMVGVGQAIDILGGKTKAAPRWMTRIGVEWAYRMLGDPLRIGQRVFIGTPRFMWWMLRARLRRRRSGRG